MFDADLIVVGGGPAGLACAIFAAQNKLSCIVLEKSTWPRDKACGEGLMPKGVQLLERMGVLDLIDAHQRFDIAGICYVQENGNRARGHFSKHRQAMGIRRTVLSQAMYQRAKQLGVLCYDYTQVERIEQSFEHADVVLKNKEKLRAGFVIDAGGLHSGLSADVLKPSDASSHMLRFGMRRHIHMRPWSDCVEVYFHEKAECYVTPVSFEQIGIAFLWRSHHASHLESVSFDDLLGLFPNLQHKIEHAPVVSQRRGAGPLRRVVTRAREGRVIALGDAAGYVDAITGEGLSMAFATAEQLVLQCVQAQASDWRSCLRAYDQTYQYVYLHYAWLTRAVLFLASHPWLRRFVVAFLSVEKSFFDFILRFF